MVYQWRIPGIIPVDAQTAGEELDRIYRRDGVISPDAIVNDNAEPSAPLHCCFEWDDGKAAHKYRVSQAQSIIQAIVSVPEETQYNQPVRAFVSVFNSYHPTKIVMQNVSMRSTLLEFALADLRAFKRKYESLVELSSVFDSISNIMEELA